MSLIDVIEKLNEGERKDFTAWLSKLDRKEQEAVANELKNSPPERIRTVLSIPEENRVALFTVKRNAIDETGKKVGGFLTSLDKQAGELAVGLEKHLDKFAEEQRIKREKRKQRGFFGRLLNINIRF